MHLAVLGLAEHLVVLVHQVKAVLLDLLDLLVKAEQRVLPVVLANLVLLDLLDLPDKAEQRDPRDLLDLLVKPGAQDQAVRLEPPRVQQHMLLKLAIRCLGI